MRLIEVQARQIFTQTKLPGTGKCYAINQYVGCQHACLYCYAKFICKWKPYGSFGTWVEAKVNAPDLVKGMLVNGEIVMSTVSDPYQAIEAKLELTRRLLEASERKLKYGILTKSPLILRDIELLKEFPFLTAGLTINGFDAGIEKLFEPNAPRTRARINALQKLSEEGINSYAFLSPIIPGLFDYERAVQECKSFVNFFYFELLNLRASGIEFQKILRERFPESYEILTNKEKCAKYLQELRSFIKRSNLQVAGIIVH